MLAGLALALRFMPYSYNGGHLRLWWSLALLVLGLIVAAASVYLVYLLEILKFRGRGATQPQLDATDATSPSTASAAGAAKIARATATARRSASSAGAPRSL